MWFLHLFVAKESLEEVHLILKEANYPSEHVVEKLQCDDNGTMAVTVIERKEHEDKEEKYS